MSKINHQHPFHMVNRRPWPLLGSIGALLTTGGLVAWFHKNRIIFPLIGLRLIIIALFFWWYDVIKEAKKLREHTSLVVGGIKIGFILFILSEIMFFFSFFWAFFHSSLSPTPEIGLTWPPTRIKAINPWGVPLLNTAILLSSGASLTWSHHGLQIKKKCIARQGLFLTILLGIWFTALQAYEYWEARFTIADKVYGNTFFVATGFHGLHVIIGTTFLAICWGRMLAKHFIKPERHVGYECAIWYWHFVDVVWIFLFICIYWWGGA